MNKYDLNGVHVLNKFLWASMVNSEIMVPSDYGQLVPIIPTQQEPVFVDLTAGKPFIVYTYLVAGYDVNIWAHVEQVTYRIFSDDEQKLRRITNFIVDSCRRFDWSAQDVNNWVSAASGFPIESDDRQFDFQYIHVVGSTSPEPREENGRLDSSVTVRMAYTREENGNVAGPGMGMRL